MLAQFALAFLILVSSTFVQAGNATDQQSLPTIGVAPDFSLISQNGEEVTLHSLRNKVVAVTFIYTWCPDICLMLTDKMARVQDALGAAFGTEIAFVSITFDPERDTPETLKAYAEAFDVNFAGWSFLTGAPDAVQDTISDYGVIAFPTPDGAIDHNTLTTLVDRNGMMRVQYAGFRFDPEEFRDDLLKLVNEP